MRQLTINNLGPIKEAKLNLGQTNVIIGPQSSGKSTVLKTACYCSWVEKRLELSQQANGFGNGSTFIDIMADYYKMNGYIQTDTYIEYETEHLKFSYFHKTKTFCLNWKEGQWNYKRAKVSYVPADRNLVAAIPAWSNISLGGNMIDFMSDWDGARKFIKEEPNCLNLGIAYFYDSYSNTDTIRLDNGKTISLSESSSGIQSLLPLYIHLDYITRGMYVNKDVKMSFEQKEENRKLISTIYSKLNKTEPDALASESISIGGFDYAFTSPQQAAKFEQLYKNYTNLDHSEIFIEEPEDNLFPPTQCLLINWMDDITKVHDDFVFLATHSPYILNQIIKIRPKDLSVFFTHLTDAKEKTYKVRQLEDQEITEIYDNGVDMFFNFELYV